MFPTKADPVRGVVVKKEVAALREAGLDVGVIRKQPGWRGYLRQARAVLAHSRCADVVHAHYGTSGFVAALCCGRTPLVVTMHGSDIALGPRPRWSKYWIQYLLSVAGAARARRIIVQDDTMVYQLPRPQRGRVVVLGQAVGLPVIPPQPVERQGVLFLSSRHRVVKRFPLAEAAVGLIAGVRALDSLDRHEVSAIPDAMEVARVGLLTSEREGMPVAVKEALAAGLRVVAVDLPGLRSIADDVPEAITLTKHDPSAIAAGVASALQADPLTETERTRLHDVLRARGWVEPDRTYTLMDIYRRVVGDAEASPTTFHQGPDVLQSHHPEDEQA
ncbi:glycosyltransferase [Mobilicoccus caccae]|uniref:Glycosyltransferase subfamily 4-like N-terminal domain-containing protein n=1 Tax=Mobilicoccus caccae TaxID=1859295 RepID=A0ABQ6ITS0_9MICO|nr:glycosyltransferase [Mobilicoccus caccae]GMA40693.1 hypothetical protein GCM10025883_27380 [Mobilicoccus caccae]